MNEQERIDYELGHDTLVRDYQTNIFKKQSSQIFQMIVGEIEITEPEPLFVQNFVTVKMARGGKATTVAYPGAFVDPITKNIHGIYEGPIPGQMVIVGFENGNAHAPFVINKYPYQGAGNSVTESSYFTPLTINNRDATDVILGHFSGSYLSFNTGIFSGELPGSVTLNSVTTFQALALNGTGATLTMDSLFEIKNIVTDLKTEIHGLIDELSTLIDNIKAIVTTGGPTTQTISAGSQAVLTTDQVVLAARKISFATLLK